MNFEKQTEKYKNKILGNKPRIIIEAGSSLSWYKYLNKNDLIISLDTFGESGKAKIFLISLVLIVKI